MPFEPFEPFEPLEPLEPLELVQPIALNETFDPDDSPALTAETRPVRHSSARGLASEANVPESIDGQIPEATEPAEPPEPMQVRILRSARRKKSVGAQIKDGVVEVTVPMWMSRAEADKFAEQFRKRFEKARSSTSVDLAARAKRLSKTYGLPKPLSIRWVTNQNSRWGSCTPTDSTIRINNRLAKVPTWVLDYVIVHEICHLRHPNHSTEFWALVNTYPLTERARGFLLGMGMIEDGDDSEDAEPVS